MRYCGRPFFTKTQMDNAIIARWNAVVAPGDTVYHLGDVAMHTAPMKRIMPQLNGNHLLIVGNHDMIYPYFLKTRGQKFIDRMNKEYMAAGFSEIIHRELYLDTRIGYVRLCHFPTKNTYDNYHNDMHDANRPEDVGILNICGHVHDNWLKRGNNINVGVDVWNFTPVLLDDIISLWRNGPQNIETPYKFRRFMWKIYHTIKWRLTKLFKKPNIKKQ